jgi:hypothetical protein
MFPKPLRKLVGLAVWHRTYQHENQKNRWVINVKLRLAGLSRVECLKLSNVWTNTAIVIFRVNMLVGSSRSANQIRHIPFTYCLPDTRLTGKPN